jgi:peptide deformylase
MAELMQQASGLGLAANQVGIPRRMALVKLEGEPAVLVDPEIVSVEGTETAVEGCLSLPRLYADVNRPSRVVIRARDLSGKRLEIVAEDLLARAICHEIDHLDGTLFIDRADQSTLHWLVGTTEEGEQITQPTRLEEALKVFTASPPPPSRETEA